MAAQAVEKEVDSPERTSSQKSSIAEGEEKTDGDDLDYLDTIKSHLHRVEESGASITHTGFLFTNLSVSGSQPAIGSQADVGTLLTYPLRPWEYLSQRRQQRRQILENLDGVVHSGELLLVLGRPGSGCSTFLKALAGESQDLRLDDRCTLHFDGIAHERMRSEFSGEVLCNMESDKHFPHLTVDQTLAFAARCRTPRTLPSGLTHKQYAKLAQDLVTHVFGLTNVRSTRVGDEFVRGISGGERKRLSIAEMALAGAPLGFWDAPTNGLDSSSALTFARALRSNADLTQAAHAAAIYQASQPVYDQFNLVTLLYEGKQVFFGPTSRAKAYFEEMGWECAERQITSDFLTGLTNPTERKARAGYERLVPRTVDEFERRWRESADYERLQKSIQKYNEEFLPRASQTNKEFRHHRSAARSKLATKSSPFTLDLAQQILLCTKRAYQRAWNDRSSTVSMLVGQVIMALIIGSMFYGQAQDTASLFTRGGVLFFTITINALLAITEINGLYAQRGIVAKQASYAFCSPAAECVASVLADIPVKLLANVAFNIVLYFLAGLRETPGAFFTFFLFNFLATLTMSLAFRTIAQATKTISQAMVFAGVLIMGLVIYAGLTPPEPNMRPWFSWIRYINPVAYAFEALMLNEFHHVDFPCSSVVPPYPRLIDNQTNAPYFACTTQGSIAGQLFISGDRFLFANYGYRYSHLWRNLGVMMAFVVFLFGALIVAATYIPLVPTVADKLVFRPSKRRELERQRSLDASPSPDTDDPGPAGDGNTLSYASEGATLTWKNLVYDVQIDKKPRRLLDHSSGFVQPGCLTALMGVSGAGKTTLLDTLACRKNLRDVTGEIMLDQESVFHSTDFARRAGYVQQSDILTETASVREAIHFSAKLRQPSNVSMEEKVKFAESVINVLGLSQFADAIVGRPGAGLNVKQRKLVSIGIELAARPSLLFLDEPTSGLDSQSSWAVVSVLRRLAREGQTILCTIHQPSSVLFEQFDRLLLLARGGRTAYFGHIGDGSTCLIDHFENHGATKCGKRQNPAEYVIETVSSEDQRWADVWRESDLNKQNEAAFVGDMANSERVTAADPADSPMASQSARYAMPYWVQQKLVTHRLFQQYWRTPSYVLGKASLGIFAFISFSFFHVGASLQELQDATFSVFMLLSTFTVIVQQILPTFLEQRALYEVREGPSRTYAWVVFIVANMCVEFVYQIVVAIIVFACWFYPVYGVSTSAAQATILLIIVQFYIFGSTFAHLLAAALPDAQTAGNTATFLFTLIVAFNGVFVTPEKLPGFWIFLYRASPLTYIVASITGVTLHDRQVRCSTQELAVFQPAPSASGVPQNCGSYLETFLADAPGRLLNPDAIADCAYCSLQNSDQFLASYDVHYDQRWRNFGIVWAFIVFNIGASFALYWVFRVKQWKGRAQSK